MKKTFLRILLLVLSFSKVQADDLVVAADSWCPFTCPPQYGMNGINVDILSEVFSTVGTRVAYKNMGWTEAIAQARSGKLGAVVGAIKGDAPDFIFPEVPIGEQKSCFYSAKPLAAKDVERAVLENYRIGLVRGYKYGEPHDSLFAKLSSPSANKIQYVEGRDTTLQLFRLLKAKKVDLVVEDERVVQYLKALPNKPLKDLQFHNVKCFNKLPIYVAFSPARSESARLAKIFDKGMLSLQEGVKLKKIRAKYSIE